MFNEFKYGKLRGLLSVDLDTPQFRELLETPERLFDHARILKDSRTTKVAIFEFDGRNFLLKRYNPKGLRYMLRYLFRKTRPFRHLRASEAVATAGVPTPRALAALEERKWGIFAAYSYLITEVIENLQEVGDYLPELCDDQEKRAAFIKEVAGLLGHLHEKNVVHGDLKLSNIFRCPSNDGVKTGFFDLDGCRVKNLISMNDRCEDAARFLSSWQLSSNNLSLKIHDIKAGFLTHYPLKLDTAVLENKISRFLGKAGAKK